MIEHSNGRQIMQKPKIYLDLDETTVDLCTKWSYYYNNKYGTFFTRDTVPYGLCEMGEDGEKWLEFLRLPGFMRDLPFIEEYTQPILKDISNYFEIHPVTRAASGESAKDKYMWVHSNLRIQGIISTMKHLHITGDKGSLDPTNAIMLDDDPKNLTEFKGRGIIYTRPWNMDYETERRAESWDDVIHLLFSEGM